MGSSRRGVDRLDDGIGVMTTANQLRGSEGESSSDYRVLEVGLETLEFRPGGLNRYFSHLVRSLHHIGVPVRVITMGQVHAFDEVDYGVVVPTRGSILRRLLAIRDAGRKEIGTADVIDAHFAMTALPLVMGSFRHLPLVVHFQGPWADESAATGQAKIVCALKKALECLVYRRASAFVVLSQSFRRLLIETYRVNPWNINVIYPGVDTDLFRLGGREAARSALGVPAGASVVVTVRRLIPRMGLDVMVCAWAEVVSRLGAGAHWLVVGDGPSRADLEASVARFDIVGNVHFLGAVDENLLVECYQAADLSVVPSLELEGFGLCTLESLACGTPVMASDVGGLREAVGPLATNLLVPSGDATALADRLQKALNGEIEVPNSAQCRRYAEQFSWNEVAQKHVVLFRDVVARHRTGPTAAMRRSDRNDIRVVVVGHTAKLSGGELAILRQIEAIEGARVHVILAEDGPLIPLLERAGATVEVLPLHPRARELRRERASLNRVPVGSAVTAALYVLRLGSRIRRIDPDLVHTNTLKAALYGGLAARLARRPCLWHIRDRISDDYLLPASVRMIRLLARVVPTEIVVNSKATLEALTNGHGLENSAGRMPPIAVVPSPVQMNDLIRERVADGNALRFVMVGRLAPWKGQDVFLRAFAAAFAGGPQRAIVAGAPMFGEEIYHDGLVDLVGSLGIAGQVEFRGFVENVQQLLVESDVLVHASVIPEPFGQVVVEGMAAGLAVVAANEGGPAETVTSGFDGLLVPPGDVSALADALQRLGEDGVLRQYLGDNGRATARKYRPEVIAARIFSIYERLAGKAVLAETICASFVADGVRG